MCYNVYVIIMKKGSKKKKRKLSIYKIIGLVLFVVSIVLIIMISMLGILPTKYYIGVIGAFLVINIPLDLFLFRKKIKKRKRNIATVVAILLILGMFLPIIYIGKTLGFIDNIGTTDYKLENYSLIVLKSSKYTSENDIKGLAVGIYENTDGIKKAKDKLLNKVDVTFENYESIEEITNNLLDSKIEVIMLEDSIFNMIKEDNPEFEDKTRVIYKFKIKLKSENEAKDVNVVNEPFNIYITGIDVYGDISSVSRSDVNIVMTVNPKTKQILLTSIPRDYYVELHGKKGSRDKLTHAGIYGTDMSIGTIEDLLGIEINYYIKVNFSSFVDIINALGGIEVYSKYSFTSMDGYNYTEGYNKMNGEEALSFARERKAFVEGDRQRGADQQAVIEAVIKKVCSKSILTKYDSLLSSIEGEFQTNMDQKKIKSLIKMQLNDMANWNVTSISLDGSNGKGITYSGGNQELYVMIPDWDTVDEASSTIKAVLDGKKLDESFKPDKTKSTRVTKSYSVSNSKVDNDSKKENVKESDKDDKKEDNTKEEETKVQDVIDDSDSKEIEIIVDKKNDTMKEDKKEELIDNSDSDIKDKTENDNKKDDDKIEDIEKDDSDSSNNSSNSSNET